MGGASIVRLSVGDAIDRLQPGVALEEFSPLGGSPALIIDLDVGATHDHAALARATATLRELACPTIGVVGTEGGAIARVAKGTATEVAGGKRAGHLSDFARRLDVVVGSNQELDAVVAAVTRRPIAAMTLVQLLRHGEGLDLHEALIAESLAYSTLQSGPEFADWLRSRKKVSPAPPGAEAAVVVSRDGARLDVVLNRPERHNAYSAEMRDALAAALEVAIADSSIEEIVLGGRGPSFSAGGDLAEFGTLRDPATAHAIRSTRNVARLLAGLSPRVRAQVHGACIGAGAELAAFAERVVARSDAFFELPEVSMGLVPGAGGTASIPRRIGRQRTAYLALGGKRIDAATALRWGLVDEIAD